MDDEKRARLEAKGCAVVEDAADWLGLDEVERKVVEFRVRVGREVRCRRDEAGVSQAVLARAMGSSKSRVAKVETSDDEVGVDLLLRAFFATGATLEDLAAIIGETGVRSPQTRQRRGASKPAAGGVEVAG